MHLHISFNLCHTVGRFIFLFVYSKWIRWLTQAIQYSQYTIIIKFRFVVRKECSAWWSALPQKATPLQGMKYFLHDRRVKRNYRKLPLQQFLSLGLSNNVFSHQATSLTSRKSVFLIFVLTAARCSWEIICQQIFIFTFCSVMKPWAGIRKSTFQRKEMDEC